MPTAYPPMIVMGVSGSGKSTIGTGLADATGLTFLDGDTLHPQANKDKMAAGQPLDDVDRAPWLAIIADRIGTELAAGNPIIVACSALKRKYRDQLRAHAPSLTFVHLVGTKEVIAARQAKRRHEYMPDALLDSQFAALEPLQADERGVDVSIDQAPQQLIAEVLRSVAALD